MKINSGEIWLANLNPGKGTEPGKTRPIFIAQCQPLLDSNHPSVVAIPLTTNLMDDSFPLRVRIKAQERLKQESDLLIDQIRSIDIKRLTEEAPLTHCSDALIEKIHKAICEVIGMESLAV